MSWQVFFSGLMHDALAGSGTSPYLMALARVVSPVLDWMLGETMVRESTLRDAEFRWQSILMGMFFSFSIVCPLVAYSIDDNVGSNWMAILISSTMPLFSLLFGGVARNRRRFVFSLFIIALTFNSLPRAPGAAFAKISTTSGLLATFTLFFGVICNVLFHRWQIRYGQCRVEVMLTSTVIFLLFNLSSLRLLATQEKWTEFLGVFIMSWIYYRSYSRYTEQVSLDTFLLAVSTVQRKSFLMLVFLRNEAPDLPNYPYHLFQILLVLVCYVASKNREQEKAKVQ